MSNTQPSKLDEIFETLNGSGAHACYCPRSVDGGCKCALKDEYVAEAEQSIKSLILQIYGDSLHSSNSLEELSEQFNRRVKEL